MFPSLFENDIGFEFRDTPLANTFDGRSILKILDFFIATKNSLTTFELAEKVGLRPKDAVHSLAVLSEFEIVVSEENRVDPLNPKFKLNEQSKAALSWQVIRETLIRKNKERFDKFHRPPTVKLGD